MTRDYSLWLLPKPRKRVAWRALICRLADTFEAPPFEPHVTLLGGIAASPAAVVDAAREWTASAAPLSAHPRAVACHDEYYRCVFVELEKTPELIAARRRAEDMFAHEGGDYFPHLSLLYGHLDGIVAKRRAISAATESFDGPYNGPFALPSAALVAMDKGGTPADWEIVEVFPLSAKAKRAGGRRPRAVIK